MLVVAIVYAVIVLCLFIIGTEELFIKGFRNGRIKLKKATRDQTVLKSIALFILCLLFPLSFLLVALSHSVLRLKLKWDKTKYYHYFDFEGKTVYVDKRGVNGEYLITEKGNFVTNTYSYEEYMKHVRSDDNPLRREEHTKIMLEEVYPYLDELERRNFLKAIR